MGQGDVSSEPLVTSTRAPWAAPVTAPVGWYPSPWGAGLAYFDGHRWREQRPGFAPPEPRHTYPLVVGFTLYGIVLVSLILDRSVSYSIGDRVNSVGAAILVLVGLILLGYGPGLVYVNFVRRRWGAGAWSSVGWKWTWPAVGWGLLAGIAGILTEGVVGSIVKVLHIPIVSNVEFDGDQRPTALGRLVLVVVVVIVAPFAEELMFRGVVMPSLLSRLSPPLAIGVQGVMFGAIHFDPSFGMGNIGLILVLSGVGCVLGAAAYLSRSIATTIIAHAMLNGLVILVLFTR